VVGKSAGYFKARTMMKGRVYEVDEDADYNAGQPDHEKPFY
jgi:hypothetical protein